jgi:hypothetical protein
VAFWIALIVFLTAVVGGLIYAVLRAIVLWRRLKRTGSVFEAEAARIAALTEATQPHLDRASASAARLQEAFARLAVSRARLDVQLQALREARHTVRQLLPFLPGA